MSFIPSKPRLYGLSLTLLLASVCGCSGSSPTDSLTVEPAPGRSRLAGDGTLLFHAYDGDTSDSSAYGHDGTAFGNPQFTDICRGEALVFDGLDDFVSVSNTAALQPQFVTVEVRFKPARVFGNGTTFEPILVKLPSPYDFGTRVDGYDIAYQDPFNTGGRIGFGIGSQGGTIRVHASVNVKLSPDRFHYVAGTYDGNAIRLYLNGQLAATRLHNQPIAYLGGPIQIGGNVRHSLIVPSYEPQFLDGRIDFVAIHDRALSAEEIAARAVQLTLPCGD